jgi:hypothetical protein
MEAMEELVYKVKVIAHGPNRDTLQKFVDFLFQQEEFDEEPLSPECLQALEQVAEAVQKGDHARFTPWDEVKKELDL